MYNLYIEEKKKKDQENQLKELERLIKYKKRFNSNYKFNFL